MTDIGSVSRSSEKISKEKIEVGATDTCNRFLIEMATNSVSSASRIKLLSKNNYDTWSMQVEALLTKNDLWEFVNGNSTIPAEGDAARNTWLNMDKKAKADLILSIQPSELKQIRGCETSRDVWLKLQCIYASKGPARKATLLKQLMLQRLDEGGDIKDHIARFFDVVDKLESMNVQINGDLLTIMLLYSLPSTFENFRCAIESRDELPTVEVLKVKIIEEYAARAQTSGNVVAMAAGGRTREGKLNSKKGKISMKGETKCFKCGAIGHKANVCSVKGTNYSKSRKQPYHADESYVICHSVNAKTSTEINTSRAWILDSGCTAHLCADEDVFSSMSKSTKITLNLASQASAKVEGTGLVILAVPSSDGQRSIELKNTLFVPDLRTNLISVSKITDKGHTVTFTKTGAHVSDANGTKSMVADRNGDLFYLRESSECAVTLVQSL